MKTTTEKPYPPADDECCGGGACAPCVWDNYYEELRQWRAEQAQLANEQTNAVADTN